METGQARDRRSTQSGSYRFSKAVWTPSSPLARTCSPSQSARLSSLAYSETFHYGSRSRSHRSSPLGLPPLSEPQLLRLRPTSLRTQDISHLLTGVFRNLYTAEVIGEDVSTNLIKARGSENALHEEFVDELQQVIRPGARARFLPALTGGAGPSRPRTGQCEGPRARPQEGCLLLLNKCQHLLGARRCSRHRGLQLRKG